MNFFPKTCFCCLALAVASLYSQPINAQQTFQWKFAANDEFEVTFVQTTEVVSTADKRSSQSETNMTMAMDWKVTEVAQNGEAKISQSIQSIKLTVIPNAGTAKQVKIDTASKEGLKGNSAKLMKQILPVIGAEFIVVVTPQGEIKSVSVPEATLEKLRNVPGSLAIRELMTEKGIKELLGQAAITLPAKPLSPGDEWSVTTPAKSAAGDFKRIDKYTFKGTENTDNENTAVFQLATTLDPVNPEAESGKEETDLAPRMKKFSGQGSLRLNIDDGFFSHSDVANEMTTEMKYREKLIVSIAKTRIEMNVRKK